MDVTATQSFLKNRTNPGELGTSDEPQFRRFEEFRHTFNLVFHVPGAADSTSIYNT